MGGVCGRRVLLLRFLSIDVDEAAGPRTFPMGAGGFDPLPLIKGFRGHQISFHLGNHPGVGESILDCGELHFIFDGSFQRSKHVPRGMNLKKNKLFTVKARKRVPHSINIQ